MRTLFLKPPAEDPGQNVVRDFVYGCWCNGRRIGGMQMPPINELYCATHARSDRVETRFLDAQSDLDAFRTMENRGFRDMDAVVLMSSTQSFRHDVALLRQIKTVRPDAIGILFGSHPTFMPDYCLQPPEVDFIVRREPEETLRILLHALANGKSTASIEGIGFRAPSGQPVLTTDRPFLDMDQLPIPDRSLLPKGVDYFNPVVRRVPYTTMQTSRGCPGRCIFCTAPMFYGKKYRYRSAENVLQEMRELRSLGYREVFIRDETFTTNRARNRTICEAMIAEQIDLTWIANGRVDMVDGDSLALMRRAGCHLIKLGVETSSKDILENYKKGITPEQTVEAFRLAREAGLDTHAHFVVGGPGETPATLDASIRFAIDLGATTASFGILTPYPGTPLFDMVAARHPEIRDGSDSTMHNLHTEGFFSQAICGMSGDELSKWVKRAYRRFYLRPGYLLRRLLGVRSLEQFFVLTVAGMHVVSFALSGRK